MIEASFTITFGGVVAAFDPGCLWQNGCAENFGRDRLCTLSESRVVFGGGAIKMKPADNGMVRFRELS